MPSRRATPSRAPTDPVAAVRGWINFASLSRGDWQFPEIAWSDRRVLPGHLSGESVASVLRQRVEAAGLGDLPITGHSMRAGRATTAAEHGVPAECLARTTRHANIQTLARYVRPAQVLSDTSSADLGV